MDLSAFAIFSSEVDVKVFHFQEFTSSGSESVARKTKGTKNQQAP